MLPLLDLNKSLQPITVELTLYQVSTEQTITQQLIVCPMRAEDAVYEAVCLVMNKKKISDVRSKRVEPEYIVLGAMIVDDASSV